METPPRKKIRVDKNDDDIDWGYTNITAEEFDKCLTQATKLAPPPTPAGASTTDNDNVFALEGKIKMLETILDSKNGIITKLNGEVEEQKRKCEEVVKKKQKLTSEMIFKDKELLLRDSKIKSLEFKLNSTDASRQTKTRFSTPVKTFNRQYVFDAKPICVSIETQTSLDRNQALFLQEPIFEKKRSACKSLSMELLQNPTLNKSSEDGLLLPVLFQQTSKQNTGSALPFYLSTVLMENKDSLNRCCCFKNQHLEVLQQCETEFLCQVLFALENYSKTANPENMDSSPTSIFNSDSESPPSEPHQNSPNFLELEILDTQREKWFQRKKILAFTLSKLDKELLDSPFTRHLFLEHFITHLTNSMNTELSGSSSSSKEGVHSSSLLNLIIASSKPILVNKEISNPAIMHWIVTILVNVVLSSRTCCTKPVHSALWKLPLNFYLGNASTVSTAYMALRLILSLSHVDETIKHLFNHHHGCKACVLKSISQILENIKSLEYYEQEKFVNVILDILTSAGKRTINLLGKDCSQIFCSKFFTWVLEAIEKQSISQELVTKILQFSQNNKFIQRLDISQGSMANKFSDLKLYLFESYMV